jgi:hypothetical protein
MDLVCQIPFVLSRCCLVSTAVVLFLGKAPIAGALSGVSILFLNDFSSKSFSYGKDVEKWLLLSLISTEASLGSWGILSVFSYFGAADFYSIWIGAILFQKFIGVLICMMVVNDVRKFPSQSTKELNEESRIEIQVQVLRGRDLVPRDKNLFGKYVSSDPYVKVKHGEATIGKTKIIRKTLNPEWNSDIFSICLLSRALEMHRFIECEIYDHDQLSSDDPMGEIMIPLPVSQNYSSTRWYPVANGTGNHYCNDATGEILVKVEVIED